MADSAGDPPPPDTEDIFPVVYDELKRIARHHLRGLRDGAALSTTEVVHEAYLRLRKHDAGAWDGQAHFFGAASRAMRHIVVDFARRQRAAKRGGGVRVVTLDPADAALEVELDDILALDAALDRLDATDPRLRQVVELRFFGGLSAADAAGVLGVSSRTVERDWLKARLFLLEELDPGPAH